VTPATLADLHARAFSATRAWSAAEFAELLGQRGCFAHGDARCFILMRCIADEAEVLTIATAPDHRRKGLAAAVLESAEAAAKAQGAAQVFLEVAEDNTAARALYRKAGYVQVGRRPGYYVPKDGAAVAALVLRKDLLAN
jgi:ribosomal-protein-alanine N-acetyltransferase